MSEKTVDDVIDGTVTKLQHELGGFREEVSRLKLLIRQEGLKWAVHHAGNPEKAEYWIEFASKGLGGVRKHRTTEEYAQELKEMEKDPEFREEGYKLEIDELKVMLSEVCRYYTKSGYIIEEGLWDKVHAIRRECKKRGMLKEIT